MRPENELRPADEGGLAAAPARSAAADARAAVTGGFDVGAAAAAVAAAAAQPVAAPLMQDVAPLQPAWGAAAAVLAAAPIAPAGELAPDLRTERPPDVAYALDGAGEVLADAGAGAVATAAAAAAPPPGDAADGASDHAVEPASSAVIDPATGWAIEPNSGWLIEPTTGYLLDPGTGYYVEPTTGYYVDPSTGYLLDPMTGYPLDPTTGYPFDPATGLPIDVSAYQDAAGAAPLEVGPGDAAVEVPSDLAIAPAEQVAGEADAHPAIEVAALEGGAAESPAATAELPSPAEHEVAIEQVADGDDAATLVSSAGLARATELSGDLERGPSDEIPAAAAEPPSALEVAPPFASAEPSPAGDLFTELSAGALSSAADATPSGAFAAAGDSPLDEMAEIGFVDVEAAPDAAAAEPLVGPPLDLWEALAPAPEATGDTGTPPAEPASHAATPGSAEDDGKTTLWDLGAGAATARGGDPGAWPGPEDAARLDDVALASSGSFDLASDGAFAAAAEPVQAVDLPAFDLADDGGLAPDAASVESSAPLFAGAPAGSAAGSGAAEPDAAESAWAVQVAIPPGDSGIDFSAFEPPPAAPQEVSPAGEVHLGDEEILDVSEEDIVEIGDEVEALDEVELASAPELEDIAAPAIELPLEPAPAVQDEPRAAEPTVEAAEFPAPDADASPPPSAWGFFSPSFAADVPAQAPLAEAAAEPAPAPADPDPESELQPESVPLSFARPVTDAAPAFGEPHEEPAVTAAAPDAAEPPSEPAVPLAFAAPEVEPTRAPALTPRPAPPAVIALGPVDEAPRADRGRSPFDPFSDLPGVAILTTAPPPQPAAVVAELAEAAPPVPEPVPEPAEPVSGAFVSGKHRVVVHTADGQVKRGALVDAALDGPEIVIDAAASGRESIPSDRIKAIFFMLPTGETPPTPEGRRVRVTFRDGRQVAGFSRDYAPERTGFFMVPADTRTHTARIWVYQSAVRQVSVT